MGLIFIYVFNKYNYDLADSRTSDPTLSPQPNKEQESRYLSIVQNPLKHTYTQIDI